MLRVHWSTLPTAQDPQSDASLDRRLSEYKGQPFPDDTEFIVEMIVSEQTQPRGSDETRKVGLRSLPGLART